MRVGRHSAHARHTVHKVADEGRHVGYEEVEHGVDADRVAGLGPDGEQGLFVALGDVVTAHRPRQRHHLSAEVQHCGQHIHIHVYSVGGCVCVRACVCKFVCTTHIHAV